MYKNSLYNISLSFCFFNLFFLTLWLFFCYVVTEIVFWIPDEFNNVNKSDVPDWNEDKYDTDQRISSVIICISKLIKTCFKAIQDYIFDLYSKEHIINNTKNKSNMVNIRFTMQENCDNKSSSNSERKI